MTKILMYHSVGGNGNGEIGAGLYCVTAERFREQMEYIAEKIRIEERGTMDEGRETRDERREKKDHRPSAIECRAVVITFDDGLLDNYTNAYPILKEFGLKAYFFILVGRIGAEGYMNWEQIKELRDAGMTIGSHGMTHRILTTLKKEEIEYELKASKRFLEDNLGHRVDCLSIPRGFYNKDIFRMARQVGYDVIFTSDCRIGVKGSWSLEYFIKVLNNGFSLKDKASEFVKNSSKKILGAGNYDRLRTAALKKFAQIVY